MFAFSSPTIRASVHVFFRNVSQRVSFLFQVSGKTELAISKALVVLASQSFLSLLVGPADQW